MVNHRPVLDALREPRYRGLWLAGLFANAARWMDLLVLGWVALELSNSPLMVGVAAFCRSVPMMLLGPLAGVLADRFPRGRVMLAVQATNVAVSATLALLFGTGHGGLGALLALEVLLGAAWAVDFPARRTSLLTLVGPGRLTNAMSLESVSMQGSKMLGPLAGGILLARFGPAGCYLALVLLHLGALALVRRLDRRVALPGTGAAGPVVASLVDGLREVWARPVIRAVLAITVLMNALVFPYQPMLPVFARDVLRVGPERLGLLVAAGGLGALAGALAVAARRDLTGHGQVFAVGSLLAATLVIAFAATPWYLAALPLLFLAGVAESGFGTMQSAIILLAAPERTRGRAMGILSACIGAQPLGTLWIGFATSRVGAPWATAAGAALALALMIPVASRMAALAVRPLDPTRER